MRKMILVLIVTLLSACLYGQAIIDRDSGEYVVLHRLPKHWYANTETFEFDNGIVSLPQGRYKFDLGFLSSFNFKLRETVHARYVIRKKHSGGKYFYYNAYLVDRYGRKYRIK